MAKCKIGKYEKKMQVSNKDTTEIISKILDVANKLCKYMVLKIKNKIKSTKFVLILNMIYS